MTRQLIIASALLAIGAPAFAQAPAPAAAQNISRTQVVNELNAAFGRVDSNKDGFITTAEANAAQQKVGAERTAEILKDVEAQFRELDTDKNGQLTLSEFRAGAPQPKITPGDQIVKMLDANKDGKISATEVQAERLRAFDRVDATHDGAITVTERQAAQVR